MDWRWEHWMREEGMKRKHAKAVMELVHWVSKEYGARMWKARCEVEEREGRGSKQRKIDRKERLKAEGTELAEELGWEVAKVHYWFGGLQGWRQMQKRIKKMRAEIKLRKAEEERGGQRKVDEMFVGRTVKMMKGRVRGRDGRGAQRRAEKRQRQCGLGEVVRNMGVEERGVEASEWHEVNKRGRWERARVGSERKRKQAEKAEGSKRVRHESGHECDDSGCGNSRAQTRQSTLWGMWGGNNDNESRGASSRGGAAEGPEAQKSWRGPSKDRKGDG